MRIVSKNLRLVLWVIYIHTGRADDRRFPVVTVTDQNVRLLWSLLSAIFPLENHRSDRKGIVASRITNDLDRVFARLKCCACECIHPILSAVVRGNVESRQRLVVDHDLVAVRSHFKRLEAEQSISRLALDIDRHFASLIADILRPLECEADIVGPELFADKTVGSCDRPLLVEFVGISEEL